TTMQRFGLGLAPDSRTALKRALEKLGEDRLVETGMLIKPDEGDTYDRFRGRLTFPIRDPRGRVIAFGGRILGEGEPKYLNSPDTPLFEKGRILYGWALARANLGHDGDAGGHGVIVAEGYMDVIALHRAGFGGAVASIDADATAIGTKVLRDGGNAVDAAVAVAAALALLAAWTLLSGTSSQASARGLTEYDRALLFLLAFLVVGSLGRTAARLRWAVRALAAAAFAVCLCG
ncbi:MAG: toprim domain-containing protein, partial [Pyrinomonadaceae bacterium]